MSEDKIAVVTGGNRGIGRETARQLSKQGFKVVLTARDEPKGKKAADELGVEFTLLDIRDDDSVAALAEYLKNTYQQVHVLVNNAGVILPGDQQQGLLTVDLAVLSETLNTNTYGAIRVSRALASLMPAGSQIINVSSGMGALTDMNTGYPGYRLSKAALNAVTIQLSLELASQGIHVNSICPGWVRTDMGGPEATRSVEQAADVIVWLAKQGKNGPTGGFFRDREAIGW